MREVVVVFKCDIDKETVTDEADLVERTFTWDRINYKFEYGPCCARTVEDGKLTIRQLLECAVKVSKVPGRVPGAKNKKVAASKSAAGK